MNESHRTLLLGTVNLLSVILLLNFIVLVLYISYFGFMMDIDPNLSISIMLASFLFQILFLIINMIIRSKSWTVFNFVILTSYIIFWTYVVLNSARM
ncbi:hypothetical protein SAMN00790413_03500 [Deinococcus hopiensis KR-140]|uniref:Uncharacterized protein n=1 Tax=Deinococcus hopiensis KR-140 TaxID=695939 RepID=A0A1W1UXE4_9DEIO|nr:hypothetical protein SAMN00790413_03500 [Deinococcus hopiensis KR-140]